MGIENFNYFDLQKIVFISFEGIEGSGKSTQIKLLTKYLNTNTDYQVHYFREPGGTSFGEKLRDAMLGSNSSVAPLAEAHLFASSRCQLLFEKVLPLEGSKKNIVIYDRYLHSSIAYQGFGTNLGPQTVLELHKHYPLNLIPHLTIYLEIDVHTSKLRQNKRNNQKDYFESKSENYYLNLIQGFNYCKKEFPSFKTINGNQAETIVHQEIVKLIREII